MKKVTFNFLLFLFLITSLWSCDKQDGNANSQSAIVWVQHYYTGRRAPTWERIHVPSVEVSADITGNPLPEINYIKIGSKQISDPGNFYYGDGNIYFSAYDRIWIDSISEPKFNPLTIIINTSNGEIEGSITVPDTIKTFTINAADNIPLGTSLTISWTGSNADYYMVGFFHNWSIEGGYLGYSVDTIVTGNSVVFDGSRFLNDGDISDFEIYPINGPMAKPGAIPNMTGDGFGYLYVENRVKTLNKTIIIGKGIDYSIFENAKTTSATKISPTSLHQKIKSLLNL